MLLVKLDTARPVEIFSGIGLLDRIFRANNRPATVRVTVFQRESVVKKTGVTFTGT